jgi:hypothetical protein
MRSRVLRCYIELGSYRIFFHNIGSTKQGLTVIEDHNVFLYVATAITITLFVFKLLTLLIFYDTFDHFLFKILIVICKIISNISNYFINKSKHKNI